MSERDQEPLQGDGCPVEVSTAAFAVMVRENPQASYYRARYYDPVPGRFLTEDPARFPGGINFYTYVENNSVNLIDPFGFCPWQVHSRPLKGTPGKVGDIGHYYFYNTQTGQSLGLGPGGWEPNEKPGDKEGEVPDALCPCVDQKIKHPGNPPKYCWAKGNKSGDPHPPCMNCMGWVISVLADCRKQVSAAQQ